MLNQEQKDVIFGTLLGDGSLQTFSNGRTWRYRALHKEDHAEYLNNKYEVLKSLCNSPPSYNEAPDSRTNKTAKRFYFNTIVSPSLNFFANMFYTQDPKTQKWIKDVPINVEKFLTPRALAYFYMDDGAIKSRGRSNAMRLCTESFSVEGVHRLQKAMQNCFNIETTLTAKKFKDGTIRYRMAIPEKSSAAFRELIRPYLVDCMKYKVTDGHYGTLG